MCCFEPNRHTRAQNDRRTIENTSFALNASRKHWNRSWIQAQTYLHATINVKAFTTAFSSTLPFTICSEN